MKKTPRLYYIILVMIPIVFIILLEIILRVFSYGKNLEQWVEISEDKLVLNPDIGARYFTSTQNYPQSNNDAFDKIKKENTFRIFVLGGSSAAGFPYSPNGSFSRYIRDRLELLFPEKKFEVLNLGITAVNTYTIADLLPGIIEQAPDLIIIYAGHNEYYGALGAGSLESVSNSKLLINSYLYLNRFKVFQLVRNFIKWGTSLIIRRENNSLSGTTLMARMAKEKAIGYGSEIYNNGMEQFKNNLEYILGSFKKENIHVLIGTLTSNLKDLKPFISISDVKYPLASDVFAEAKKELQNQNYFKADSLFRLAKDLDGLRFRAPESFNTIIKNLAKKYDAFLTDIDAKFNKTSENLIVGNNLMIDHLHPSLNGYLFMGEIFTNKILEKNLLGINSELNFSEHQQDSIVKSNFAFGKLDSTIAHFRILNLLNDWPFAEKKNLNLFKIISYSNKIDSLALKVVKENYNWEVAHQEAYKWYLSEKNTKGFSEELKVLSSQYPFKLTYYTYAAQELIKLKAYDDALYFLHKKYEQEPDEFSAKWIGNINLYHENPGKAILYLNKSLSYNPKDAQVYYNLAIAYLKTEKYKSAIESLKNCIMINSSYPNAGSLLKQLENIIKKPR